MILEKKQPEKISNSYFGNSFEDCFCAIYYDNKTWFGIATYPKFVDISILKFYHTFDPSKVYEIQFNSIKRLPIRKIASFDIYI